MPASFVGRIASFHAPRLRLILALPLPALLLAVVAPSALQPAHALSMEQALAHCRAAVGDPIVKPCMQRLGNSGDREANLAKCKVGVPAKVMACVNAALIAANGRPAAPAAPTANKAAAAEAAKDAASLAKTFVAPPRTIADITAILDNEKPDAGKIAQRKADADVQPPMSGSNRDMGEFYYNRGFARALLSRNKEALADALKAYDIAKRGVEPRQRMKIGDFVAQAYAIAGDPKQAVAIREEVVRDAEAVNMRNALIGRGRSIVQGLIAMGDIAKADAYAGRVTDRTRDARGSPNPGQVAAYKMYHNSYEAAADGVRALLQETRGQYRDAEQSYRRAEAFQRAFLKDLPNVEYPPPPENVTLGADNLLLSIARMEAKQGRLSEAEADARRALLGALKSQGKYNPETPTFIVGLASVVVEQGRYAEAEKLARSALDVYKALGTAADAPQWVNVLSQLGSVLTLQRKQREAAEVFAQIDKAITNWEPQRRDVFLLNDSRIAALYSSGQIDAGITAAQELVRRRAGLTGEKNAASAHGTLAIGYALAGREADAIREFRVAIPVMMSATRENADDDDTTVVAARDERLRSIVEAYVGLLSRSTYKSNDAAIETFALADAVRGHSVQQALAASSARAVAKDPALAELVRKEQDFGKEINAQLGALNNALALPSGERDEKGIAAISAAVTKLRADRVGAHAEINKRFPAYADLIDPKPPSVDQVKATLVDGEAMLSFYFGRDASFVWAVPKEGAVAFAAINATSGDLESKVRKLREALEPQAAMISDIPPFDLKLGYELYSMLLKPVEAAWKPAKNLIVVTNGALGLLPLSLLPTAPAEIDKNDDPLFSSYRAVPWLARTHAVTMVPSSAALRTLRQLPTAKPGRSELVAFGDPLFSPEQAADAAKAVGQVKVADADATAVTRGMLLKRRSSPKLEGVDSAELAMLPRLPDTADELRSIAIALQADPAKALNLGKDANEQAVKTMDLSGVKVIAFATHGLVPGELNGLTQPALALSAPAVAGVEGDGLLTMEEILALKLDADWVVLSACNTGAGEGAGAEAASGLGRAFFYAGTRAILVTNWSVHSQSAKELVSDLFKRQADDPKLTRGEALRQAMAALMDGPGYLTAEGKTEFAYAHPLFWAPYSIIGDGGLR
jgi:CHAT domain-containing protein